MAERFRAGAADPGRAGTSQHRAPVGWRRLPRRAAVSGDGIRGRHPVRRVLRIAPPFHCTAPRVFRKICAAVHFAHQHLVIHRDLKPGNILVNEEGEPKLLDFGIAKVLAAPGRGTEQTLTMVANLLLTPQYASPEQIQGLPCTVASDVYSLGVILYELLAGKGPYSATASTPAEMIAAVVTGEAQRPSAVAPANLKAPLRGDLDGIAMKALAKNPEDRYGSAEQFSEDVRRHLEGLPVIAVEGTRLYVARKFRAASSRGRCRGGFDSAPVDRGACRHALAGAYCRSRACAGRAALLGLAETGQLPAISAVRFGAGAARFVAGASGHGQPVASVSGSPGRGEKQ